MLVTGSIVLSCWKLLSVLGRWWMAVTFTVQLCWMWSPHTCLPPRSATCPFPPAAPERGGESSSAALSAAALCTTEPGHALKVAVLCPHAPQKSSRADWEPTGSREMLL